MKNKIKLHNILYHSEKTLYRLHTKSIYSVSFLFHLLFSAVMQSVMFMLSKGMNFEKRCGWSQVTIITDDNYHPSAPAATHSLSLYMQTRRLLPSKRNPPCYYVSFN